MCERVRERRMEKGLETKEETRKINNIEIKNGNMTVLWPAVSSVVKKFSSQSDFLGSIA